MKRLLAVLLPAVVTVGAAAPAAASPTQVRSALRDARAPAAQLDLRAVDRSLGTTFYRYRPTRAGSARTCSSMPRAGAGRRGGRR